MTNLLSPHLQVAMDTLDLGRKDEHDPDGTTCELSPDEATALWEHIIQLRADLAWIARMGVSIKALPDGTRYVADEMNRAAVEPRAHLPPPGYQSLPIPAASGTDHEVVVEETKYCPTCGRTREGNPFCSNSFHVNRS